MHNDALDDVPKGFATSIDGKRTIPLAELDRLFDEGSDEIDDFIDWSKATRPGLAPTPMHFEWPAWMVNALERAAADAGVSSAVLVQRWVEEKLEAAKSAAVPS